MLVNGRQKTAKEKANARADGRSMRRETGPIDLVAVVQRMAYTPASFLGLAAVPALVVAACVAVGLG